MFGFVTILCQTFSPRHSETEPSNQGLITAIALSEDDVYAAVCVILNMPLGLVDVLKAESSDWCPCVEGPFFMAFGGLLLIPSLELTYHLPKVLLKMMFLFPRWDMLVPGGYMIM